MSEVLPKVMMYTDGACSGNPGPGGYGAILMSGQNRKEFSGGFRLTTNNRMEILAVITGLSALKTKCQVTVVTDSQLVVNSITKGWAKKWQANNWKRNKKDKALNPDLWQRLLDVLEKHEVEFQWVKGHAGHPENEAADQLAVAAYNEPDLEVDKIYEGNQSGSAQNGLF